MTISGGGSGGDGGVGVTLATSHNHTTVSGADREDGIEDGIEGEESVTVVIVDIPVDGLKPGLTFESEDSAVESITQWGRKTWCALTKTRRSKTAAETNGEGRGRRTLQCPHGVQRKIKSEVRTKQHVKFTRCPVMININEQDDGSFVITKAILEHSGHVVSEKEYFSHEHTKRLNEDEKAFVKDLTKVKANPRNIATCLKQKTGKDYSTQDVRNIIKNIEKTDFSVPKVEEVLAEIKGAGGVVRYVKDPVSGFVEVLLVQTRDM